MSEEKYTKIDTYFEDLKKEPQKIGSLYNENFANWHGPRSNEKQPYTDYVAEKILDLNKPFNVISSSNREEYYVEGHEGTIKQFTNRGEEIHAKLLLGHEVENLGKIIDYQVPLKKTRSDNYGKIDLVGFDIESNTAYLIEIKLGSKETLLRAALEIETYYRLIDREKFCNYISKRVKNFHSDEKFDEIYSDEIKIKKSVLFLSEGIRGNIYDTLYETNVNDKDSYPHVKQFIEKYNISGYITNKITHTVSFMSLL